MKLEEKISLIGKIISKRICGEELTPLESDTLEHWLSEDDANRDYYNKSITGSTVEDYSRVVAGFDKARNWQAIDHKIRPAGRGKIRAIARWSIAAASLIGAILMFHIISKNSEEPMGYAQHTEEKSGSATRHAVLTFTDGNSVELTEKEQGATWQQYIVPTRDEAGEERDSVRVVRVEVPRGGEFYLQLSDGSMMWLNAETVVEYPSVFSAGSREIFLVGEAFFDVVSDPSKPFVITTADDLAVAVYGTKFNVHSYADEKDVHVTLLEGAVTVNHNDRSITLVPNQQVLFDREAQELSVRAVADASVYASWVNGQFNFEMVPFGVIADALEKWYNVTIVYDKRAFDDTEVFTMKLNRRSSINQTLDIMQEVIRFNYKKEDTTVHLLFHK